MQYYTNPHAKFLKRRRIVIRYFETFFYHGRVLDLVINDLFVLSLHIVYVHVIMYIKFHNEFIESYVN